MSNWGAGLAGFANGISDGMSLGEKIRQARQEKQLADIRAQGIAEARAAQAAATPQVTDNGDADNLSSNPQSSQDPNATPLPINTSLQAAISNEQDAQAQQAAQSSPAPAPDASTPASSTPDLTGGQSLAPQQAAQAGGLQSFPVDQPSVQSTDSLSSTPLASADPNATPDPASTAPSNLDAAAKSGLAPLTPPKRFNVDGKEFDTAEDAAAYVKKSTPPLASFFKTTLIPKMTDALIAQGKPDQAAAWQKYADDQDNQEHMKTWSKAVQLAQFGDFNGSAEQLMKLHPHFEDGYDLLAAKPTKGPDGQDGFTMSVRAPDGSTQQMYQDAKTITQLGLSQLSPIEMFNKKYQAQQQADVMAAKDKMDTDGMVFKNKLEAKTLQLRDASAEKRQAARDADIAARQKAAQEAQLERDKQNAAYKSAQIDQAAQLRAKAAAEGMAFKKSDSPDTIKARLVTKMQGDTMYQMASPDKKQAMLEFAWSQMPDSIRNGVGSNATGATPAKTAPSPFANGIQTSATPAQSSAPAGKMAVPVFNPATGKIETVFR